MVRAMKKGHQVDRSRFVSRGPEGQMGGEEDAITGSSSNFRSAYCLHCTVCKNNYDSRADWLQHLGMPEHQKLARMECFRTWGEDQEIMECVVAVFCSFSLSSPGTVEELLERFSCVGVDFLVTDFIWWPEKPRVGFLQFESRKKVTQVFKTLQGPTAYLQDKLVQLRKARNILSLEWKELLPSSDACTAVGENSPEISSRVTSNQESHPSPPPIIPFPSSSRIPEPQTPLQLQFNSICQSIEIPEQEFKQALQIAGIMKQSISKFHSSGQVLMFRNYHLRLKNNGDQNNVLFLYGYLGESPSHPGSYESIRPERLEPIFTEFSRLLPGFSPDQANNFYNEESNFRFNLNTDPCTIVEAQLSLLVQYLCTFDPRVKPVLTLIHFWANSQDIRIAETTSKPISHTNLPEPVALDWMVILFLIKEGILPSVRELLERPYKPLLLTKDKTDIGFSCDPKYVREWASFRTPSWKVNSDKFLQTVIQLAQQFFQFYSTNLEKDSCLLNPKDGEIIQRVGDGSSGSKLTPEEVSLLNCSNDKRLKLNKSRIYMVNPLYLKWKLSFCVKTWNDQTCRKMKSTAEALENYLKLLETGGRSWKEVQTLDSLLAGVETKGQKIVGAKRNSSK